MRGIRTVVATIASALVLASCSGEAEQVTGDEKGAELTPSPAASGPPPSAPASVAPAAPKPQEAPQNQTQQQSNPAGGGGSSSASTPTPAPNYDYPSATPGGPDVPSVPGPGY